MATVIPLIRGFALLPTLRWLADHGVATETALASVDLPADLISDPFRPVPLVHVAALLRNAARDFGPDLPCRIISTAGSLELAMLGKVGLGARTPGELIARVVAALPYYCSHEQVTVRKEQDTYVVGEFFAHRFDPETAHVLLQYASAMVDRVLGMAGDPPPRYLRLEIPPHPIFGIDHLRKWYGDRVFATRSRGFTAVVDEHIVHRPFASIARDRLNARALPDAMPLRGDGTLAGSVKTLLVSMLDADDPPTMKRVVAATGTSARTFQRQLDNEGTNFSDLLAEVRHSETLRRLNERNSSIAAIAADLGYADQASFTRAFRRWAGSPPSQFRSRTA
jgi:AraC-like DNA-binding protein